MMEKLAVKIVALSAAVLLIFAAGGWAGHKISESRHLAKISRLEVDLGAAKNAEALSSDLVKRFEKYCNAIDKAAEKQDEAVAELADQAKALEVAAAAASARARKDSAKLQRDAASILAKPAPTKTDGCVAASTAFDDELRAERKGAKP